MSLAVRLCGQASKIKMLALPLRDFESLRADDSRGLALHSDAEDQNACRAAERELEPLGADVSRGQVLPSGFEDQTACPTAERELEPLRADDSRSQVLPSGFEVKMLVLPLRDMERSERTSLLIWLCTPASKIILPIPPLREKGNLDLPILGI
jgi:hypothetical protein